MNTSLSAVIATYKRARGKYLSPTANFLIYRSASGAFAIQIIGMLLGFVTNVLVARWSGTTNYGIYNYVYSWTVLIALLVQFGFDKGAIRFISAYRAEQQWELLKGFIRFSTIFVIIMGVVGAGLLALIAFLMRDQIDLETLDAWYISVPLVIIYSLVAVQERYLQGLRKISLSRIPTSIISTCSFLTVVGAIFYWNGSQVSARQLIFAFLFAYFITLVSTELLLRLSLKEIPIKQVSSQFLRLEWIRTSAPLMLFSSLIILNSKMDIIMLGSFQSADDVGIYAAANRIVKPSLFALTAMNAVIAPLISEKYAKGELKQLQKVIARSTRTLSLVSIALCLVVLILHPYILDLFGPEYRRGSVVVMLLLLGNVINILAGPAGFLLTMTGHQMNALFIMLVGLLINAGLNYLLIFRFGMNGAALATAISIGAYNIILTFISIRHTGINPSIFARTGN